MHKLIFFIIIFSTAFSKMAEAQNASHCEKIETLSYNKTKDYSSKSEEKLIVEYASIKNETNHKNKAPSNSLQSYKIRKKPAENHTNHSQNTSEKNTIPKSKFSNLKYVHINNASNSINRDKHHLGKEN